MVWGFETSKLDTPLHVTPPGPSQTILPRIQIFAYGVFMCMHGGYQVPGTGVTHGWVLGLELRSSARKASTLNY